MRAAGGLFGLALLLAATGCARTVPPMTCAAGMGPPVIVFTLYFGESISGRRDLTDAEWQQFVDSTITPNLPNGYTLWNAHGAWMSPMTRKTIKEPTKVLAVALPVSEASLVSVNRIRDAYQIQFHQEIVGMTAAQACGAF
jgi:hypothetical protein